MAKRNPEATEPAALEWPAERVEKWPLEQVREYPSNARVHTDAQIDLLAKSITEFGMTTALLVDEDGVLIYGHGRFRALKQLGKTDAPIMVARGWSEAKKKAYRIADNQHALSSRWDDVLLRAEFKELELAKYDTDLLGFEPGQLAALSLDYEAGKTVPESEWTGMPNFEAMGGEPFKIVRVLFKDQAAFDKFAKLVGQEITGAYIWYPEIKRQSRVSKKFVAAE